jgi:hypothetical protein
MARRRQARPSESDIAEVGLTASATGQAEPNGEAPQPLGRREHNRAQHDVAAVGGASGDEGDAIHGQAMVMPDHEPALTVRSTLPEEVPPPPRGLSCAHGAAGTAWHLPLPIAWNMRAAHPLVPTDAGARC